MSTLTLLASLLLGSTSSIRAETPPSVIPLSEVGARATAEYQGDALGITATADGARLQCGFQKLADWATSTGPWLESTGPGAVGKLRLVATTIHREVQSAIGHPLSTLLPATGTVSVQGKIMQFKRPGLTEEYSLSVDGVRQDFIVTARPAVGEGSVRTINNPQGLVVDCSD